MKTLLIGSAALGAVLLAAQATAGFQDGEVHWARHLSSIVTPSRNIALSGWEAYKHRTTQPSADQHLVDPILKGAIDIHAHFGPDTYPRQWDLFEIARLAQQRGMRGIVFKNHWSESAGLAYLVRKYATPGFEVFGSLSLNTPEGGINPEAVRYFAEVTGGYGKVVWMPTHDSEHEVRTRGEVRPYVQVSRGGALLPEVFEVLDLIARYDLTLATGHVTDAEMLMIVREARQRGVKRIIITHPNLGPMYTDPTNDQLLQMAELGAFIEIVGGRLRRETSREAALATIRAVGVEHCIISTDSGLVGTANSPDALVLAARELRKAGFSEHDLETMFKRNPAMVLGLSVE